MIADGETDDSEAIRQYFAEGHKTLPKGLYFVGSPVTAPDGKTLLGMHEIK